MILAFCHSHRLSFLFNDTAATKIYTLSLHDALPIYDAAMLYKQDGRPLVVIAGKEYGTGSSRDWAAKGTVLLGVDRKSTRLNSSHRCISYAVFCLKKKKKVIGFGQY